MSIYFGNDVVFTIITHLFNAITLKCVCVSVECVCVCIRMCAREYGDVCVCVVVNLSSKNNNLCWFWLNNRIDFCPDPKCGRGDLRWFFFWTEWISTTFWRIVKINVKHTQTHTLRENEMTTSIIATVPTLFLYFCFLFKIINRLPFDSIGIVCALVLIALLFMYTLYLFLSPNLFFSLSLSIRLRVLLTLLLFLFYFVLDVFIFSSGVIF